MAAFFHADADVHLIGLEGSHDWLAGEGTVFWMRAWRRGFQIRAGEADLIVRHPGQLYGPHGLAAGDCSDELVLLPDVPCSTGLDDLRRRHLAFELKPHAVHTHRQWLALFVPTIPLDRAHAGSEDLIDYRPQPSARHVVYLEPPAPSPAESEHQALLATS